MVSPEVDGAAAHHLRELGDRDGHGDEARDPIVHSLECVIRVHERVNGKVHHDEPTRWRSVLFESVPRNVVKKNEFKSIFPPKKIIIIKAVIKIQKLLVYQQ